jgi:hypothetical protein
MDGMLGRLAVALLLTAPVSVHPSFRSLAAQDTLPTGLGTLRRDEITVRLATGTLEIQVLPLDEDVIRLLAPDTYRSLSSLVQSRRRELEAAANRGGLLDPSLIMVTFFALQPQARFMPEDLDISSRGRLFRPVALVPLTPAWANLQLEARQQASAIYLFEDGISFREALTVSYQGLHSDSWSRSINALERERSRVLARAQGQRNP